MPIRFSRLVLQAAKNNRMIVNGIIAIVIPNSAGDVFCTMMRN